MKNLQGCGAPSKRDAEQGWRVQAWPVPCFSPSPCAILPEKGKQDWLKGGAEDSGGKRPGARVVHAAKQSKGARRSKTFSFRTQTLIFWELLGQVSYCKGVRIICFLKIKITFSLLQFACSYQRWKFFLKCLYFCGGGGRRAWKNRASSVTFPGASTPQVGSLSLWWMGPLIVGRQEPLLSSELTSSYSTLLSKEC